MIIGIDVGGSTTKIVGMKDGEIKHPMFVTAKDPVTSLFGAFGKYIYDHSIQIFGGGAGNADRSGKFIHSAALVRSAYGSYG